MYVSQIPFHDILITAQSLMQQHTMFLFLFDGLLPLLHC